MTIINVYDNLCWCLNLPRKIGKNKSRRFLTGKISVAARVHDVAEVKRLTEKLENINDPWHESAAKEFLSLANSIPRKKFLSPDVNVNGRIIKPERLEDRPLFTGASHPLLYTGLQVFFCDESHRNVGRYHALIRSSDGSEHMLYIIEHPFGRVNPIEVEPYVENLKEKNYSSAYAETIFPGTRLDEIFNYKKKFVNTVSEILKKYAPEHEWQSNEIKIAKEWHEKAALEFAGKEGEAKKVLFYDPKKVWYYLASKASNPKWKDFHVHFISKDNSPPEAMIVGMGYDEINKRSWHIKNIIDLKGNIKRYVVEPTHNIISKDLIQKTDSLLEKCHELLLKHCKN